MTELTSFFQSFQNKFGLSMKQK